MSITKISQFPTMSASDVDSSGDVLPIVDTNLGTNKKITLDTIGSSITASVALFALNAGSAPTGSSTPTGSLLTTGSVSLNTLTFTKGDNSTFSLTVNTGSGGGSGVNYWGLDTGATYFSTPTITSSRNVVIPEADFVVNGGQISGSSFKVHNGSFQVEDSIIRFQSSSVNSILRLDSAANFNFNKTVGVTGSITTTNDITVGDDLTVTDTTSTKNLFSSGSIKRRVTTKSISVANATGAGVFGVGPDDDIVVITGNSTTPGVSDYTVDVGQLFRKPASFIGRTVVIVNGNSAANGSIILGSADDDGGNYTVNGVSIPSTTYKWAMVNNTLGESVTLTIIGARNCVVYGSGI